MKSGSLYVADFQESVTALDLEALIGKFVSVTSTYIPGPTPTGLVRRFALLRVGAKDDTAITDCARKLNNCQWKGCRLRVEIARPYFADRLAEERKHSVLTIPCLEAGARTVFPTFDPSEKNGVLRIRRFFGQHEFISSTCDGVKVLKRGETEFKVRQLGRRITFDYDSEDCMVEAIDSGIKSGDVVVRNPFSKVDTEASYINIPVENIPSQSMGRRGFGTLLEIKKRTRESNEKDSAEDSYLNAIEIQTKDPHELNGEFASGHLENEEDLRHSKSDNESDDDVHIPSCSAEELDSETLLVERKRALQIFSAFFTNSETGQTQTDVLQKPVVPPRLNKRGWEAVSETASLRFDPTSDDGGTRHIMDADQKAALLIKVRMRDDERYTQDSASSSLEAVAAEVSHADLGELKDIFSRQAGVWFGDDGDLNESVRKGGGDALDDIFLAAEKRGLDIRTKESATNQLTFDFFGENAEFKPEIASENKTFDESSSVYSDSDADTNFIFQYSADDLGSVFLEAKRFCRASETSEEQIQSAWRASREKGALDYKRRIHDLKRRNKRLGLVPLSNSKPNIPTQSLQYNKAAFKTRGGRRGQGRKLK